jgi:hypothetical protein
MGSGDYGGARRERYSTAKGSARETVGCLDVAVRRHFIPPIDPELSSRLNHVIAVLVINSR